MTETQPLDDIRVSTRQPGLQSKTQRRKKRPPQYAVVLHNDCINRFAYVVHVLRRVLGYSQAKAFRLTLTAHLKGRCDVWIGSLEVSEFKADQIRSCGPDPLQLSAGSMPLTVTIERKT